MIGYTDPVSPPADTTRLITDQSNNPVASFTAATVSYTDTFPPTFSISDVSTTSSNPTAKIGDMITVTLTADHNESDLRATPNPTINGESAIFTNVGDGTYSFTSEIVLGNTDVDPTSGTLSVNLNLQDPTNNIGTAIISINSALSPGVDANPPSFSFTSVQQSDPIGIGDALDH